MPRIEIRVLLTKNVSYAMLEVLGRLQKELERTQADRLIEDFSISLPDEHTEIVSFTEE